MDNMLVSYVDSMSLNQVIQLPDGSTIQCPSCDFAAFIVGQCDELDVHRIHLFGNQFFISGVVDEITRKENETFGKKTIEIEVN